MAKKADGKSRRALAEAGARQLKQRSAAILEALGDKPELKAELVELVESLYLNVLPATADGALSYEHCVQEVQEALNKRSSGADGRGMYGGATGMERCVLVATFPDYCVYMGRDDDLFKLGYRMDGTECVLDEAEPVEMTAEFRAAYPQEVAEARRLAESQDLVEAGPAGSIRAGRINRELSVIEGTTLIGAHSKNGTKGRRYSSAALKKIASMAEGLPGYLNHVAPELAFKPRDVKDIAVRHRNVRYDPTTETVRSDMHVAPHHADLVFGLAETFGDHIGNSLVSKGLVTMEGDTEVVQDVVALRSADIVSDPASTRGLFEGAGDPGHAVSIVDFIESLKQAKQRTTGGETVDIAAILTHLKDKPEDQKLLAEHFGFVPKADAAKLQESAAALTGERDGLKAKVAEHETALAAKDKSLLEAKSELDGFRAKDALAAKRAKLSEAIAAHAITKEFGAVKGAVSDEFRALLEGMDEAAWAKQIDDRYAALKGVPRGQQPRSDLKDQRTLREAAGGDDLPEGVHGRVAALLGR